MYIKIFFLLALLLISCNNKPQSSATGPTAINKAKVDTIVGSRIIMEEIAGSEYRKRAIGYFVITGKDTSDYTCIFTQSKDRGEVGIVLNIPYMKTAMPYSKRLEELKIILGKAENDFNFDSLRFIGFGRLILSGDLAVDITKQYQQKFGTKNKLESYSTVQKFLMESKLVTDLKVLFRPYSITVDKIYCEKLFFTTREDLYWASKIETDTMYVPEKIIDCILSVQLKKVENN